MSVVDPFGFIRDFRSFLFCGAFNPLTLSPVRWLDASDTSTITESGGEVSLIADKSGNGNDASQATAGQKPTTGATTLNGLNVLDFDGIDDQLDVAGISGWEYLVLVYKAATTDSTQSFGSSGSTTNILGLFQNGSGVAEVWRNFTVPTVYVGGTPVTLADRNAAYDAFIDDSAKVIIFRVTAGQTNLTKFLFSGAGYVFLGSMAEVLFLPSSVTTGGLNSLGKHLSRKWGLPTWVSI